MLTMRCKSLSIAISVVLFAPGLLRAGIVSIDPFVGTSSENFDNTGVEGATQSLNVFGGLATITNLTSGGALKLERSSSLDGDLVVPRSDPWMVGQLGIAQWTFSSPVSDFGGYFENNSRFDDAVVDFYDKSGSLIDTLSATIPKDAQEWTWNGWHSDTPIGKIVITGNDAVFFHGFIWYDDFEVNVASVPEPSSWVLLATACLLSAPWACRRASSRCAKTSVAFRAAK
jgi:hypothetical protein